MNKKCPICQDETCEKILYEKNGVLARYGFLNEKPDQKSKPYELTQDLYYCKYCDFAWNVSFEYEKIDYDSDAIIESGTFSKRYMDYQYMTTKYLRKLIGFTPEVMVEIGAGSGLFIKEFDADKKVAIEPSDEAKRIDKSITVYNEIYTKDKFNFVANLVVSRQVLEHIANPVEFIQDIISSFKGEMDEEFFIYLEVPNSMLTFRFGRFYDFYYEHCNYFTVNSLIHLAKAVNMEIVDVSTGMDGEVISMLMKSGPSDSKKIIKKIDTNKEMLKSKIDTSLDAGKKIFAWGASGNGVQILNNLGLNDEMINYVIDSDVNKQGKFLPGTLQKIISPSEAVDYRPDVVIVLTQFHKSEILEQCKQYFKDAEVWFV
jgi:hypothetical protein